MHFPRLRVAVLGRNDPARVPDATLTAFLQHPMCTVRHLTLEALEDAILDGLAYTDRVKTICFQRYTSTSGASLHSLAQHDQNGVWLCPRLTKVTLPADDDRLSDPNVKAAVLALAQGRGPSSTISGRARESLYSIDFVGRYRTDRIRVTQLAALVDDILNPGSESDNQSSDDSLTTQTYR
ncbi:hypothetical protein AURDEDRAFT_178485 [Auricularia subglabra TFB-10046 SS5]|uniref:Uncharacterized protein n=1 Tax=Auricularia subglabra (strain TFB-10046 / SS5) TaxID=717982 RepID=J0CQI1_AURST|nr:hypothetical protein AURDEDRAFT_178485 [Auricularia subglabra TFB-10046 SS5]